MKKYIEKINGKLVDINYIRERFRNLTIPDDADCSHLGFEKIKKRDIVVETIIKTTKQ